MHFFELIFSWFFSEPSEDKLSTHPKEGGGKKTVLAASPEFEPRTSFSRISEIALVGLAIGGLVSAAFFFSEKGGFDDATTKLDESNYLREREKGLRSELSKISSRLDELEDEQARSKYEFKENQRRDQIINDFVRNINGRSYIGEPHGSDQVNLQAKGVDRGDFIEMNPIRASRRGSTILLAGHTSDSPEIRGTRKIEVPQPGALIRRKQSSQDVLIQMTKDNTHD